MTKIKLMFLSFLLVFSFLSAYAEEEKERLRDYLYSEAYFDYLIECAQQDALEKSKQQEEEIALEADEISLFKFEDEISDNYEPFKLRIEQNATAKPYSQAFTKEKSKTTIPIGQKFSIVQDTLKFRNKYNSDDYRVLAGAEYYVSKYFDISTGLETNYRGIDQNPTSRKFYFTPTVYLTDKLSFSFYNKFNIQTNSSDHDLSINVSPFKSKAVDFKVYAGITKYESGEQSESVNFYTNFYFF